MLIFLNFKSLKQLLGAASTVEGKLSPHGKLLVAPPGSSVSDPDPAAGKKPRIFLKQIITKIDIGRRIWHNL